LAVLSLDDSAPDIADLIQPVRSEIIPAGELEIVPNPRRRPSVGSMATHHPSPPGALQLSHHGPPGQPPPNLAQVQQAQQQWPGPPSRQIQAMNEAVWMQIGEANNPISLRTY
jgi:hypothetical protein